MNKQKNLKFSTHGGIGLPIVKYPRTISGIKKFIPFTGSGLAMRTDNIYPQVISNLISNSPTLGSAIQVLSLLTYGHGINLEKEIPSDLLAFLLNINENGESINDILENISYDINSFNGFALKVHWKSNKTIGSIEHVPYKNIRLGYPDEVTKKIDYCVISNDFEMKMERGLRNEYSIPLFNPDKIQKIQYDDDLNPIVDEVTSENAEQLIYWQGYSPSSNGFYTTPRFVACLDSVIGEIKIGVCQNQQISNGINGSYIISHEGDTIVDDDIKQDIVENLNYLVSGAENAGGIIYLPSSIKVGKLDPLPFDIYDSANAENRQRIITGTRVPAILLEYNFGGGFNNRSEEMKSAFDLLNQTSINSLQKKIVRVLNTIFDYVTTKPYDIQISPFNIIYDEKTPIIQEEVKDTSGINPTE